MSEEVRVASGVPQGSVLGPLLFLAYVNDIWRNIDSKIRLFADDCIIYRKVVNNHDVIFVLKLSPCLECELASFGYLPGVQFSKSDVSDHCKFLHGRPRKKPYDKPYTNRPAGTDMWTIPLLSGHTVKKNSRTS